MYNLSFKQRLSRESLLIIIGVVWIIGVVVSLGWNRHQIQESFLMLARSEAHNSLQKDLVYRRWASMHQGIYVPPTESTPPNPFLDHIPDRDLVTTGGQELTLVNPAYMTRQVQELGGEEYGLRAYLVSSNPLRLENLPDSWEEKAFLAFDAGASEVSSEAMINGRPFYRLLRPFVAEEGCLRCHGDQGYTEGDILGGIGIAVPLASYQAAADHQRRLLTWAHLVVGSLGILGLMWGNASLRRSDTALRESERRFRIMADGSPFPIWVYDSRGYTAFVNSAFCEFFGATLEDVQEKGWKRFVHPEDEPAYTEEFMSAMRGGKTFNISARMLRHDGQWRWINACAAPRFSASGEFKVMVGSNSDITDNIRAEEEIAQKNEQLQKALEVREKFFSIIAHDLRSPFMGFIVLSRVMAEKIHTLSSEEVHRFCKEMHKSAENVHNLLENLLKWSVIQQDELDYKPVVCNLAEVIRQNIDQLHIVAAHKNIRFRQTVSDSLNVSADKSMLDTILRNLFSNALKFSQAGGEVHVSAILRESMVLVSVTDFGVGMDDKLLSGLFKPDKKTSRTGTAREKGTGLGLLLCREFVLKHGGEIRAQSKPGQGTTFHFTLPADTA